MALGLDDNDAIAADTAIVQLQQPLLDLVGQRRRRAIETKMDRGRNLVDVLATRALRADRADLALFRIKGNLSCDFKHQRYGVRTVAGRRALSHDRPYARRGTDLAYLSGCHPGRR